MLHMPSTHNTLNHLPFKTIPFMKKNLFPFMLSFSKVIIKRAKWRMNEIKAFIETKARDCFNAGKKKEIWIAMQLILAEGSPHFP